LRRINRPLLTGIITSAALFCVQSAAAQGLFDLFRSGQPAAFAPSDAAKAPIAAPMNIIPLNPRSGDIGRKGSQKKLPVATPAPTGQPDLEDEDAETVFEHDTPKSVRVALPTPRPGGSVRTAAEVAPIGAARWSSGQESLPPGVDFRNAASLPPTPASIGQTRVASLPQEQAVPRWTSSDIQPLRPVGLRSSEAPVAGMPGVFAPPEANFQCLPDGLKQMLMDTATKFGHVAILNARRPSGTGARGSYHYRCRAVDFRVRGVPVSTVYAYLKQHPNVGGRKIYPFGFFHVDDGPSRSW
jgi:hypothetical protein